MPVKDEELPSTLDRSPAKVRRMTKEELVEVLERHSRRATEKARR